MKLKCNAENLEKVSNILLQQLEDESGRGEFDEKTGLLNAFERTIEWIKDDEEVRKDVDWLKTEDNNFVCNISPHNLCRCVECRIFFHQKRDLEICDVCVDKFDMEKLWKMHDNNEVDALNFNESSDFREKFRIT